jgi:hypothetical protein
MIGNEKLSSIRKKLRTAHARERSNPIPALDRRIRELEKNQAAAEPELRALRRLRSALAQVVGPKPRKTVRSGQGRRPAKLGK